MNQIDIDLAEEDELLEMLKKVMGMITQKAEGLKSFCDKHVAKPNPWDGGEDEEDFKSWTDNFTSFMATAGENKWRGIIKE